MHNLCFFLHFFTVAQKIFKGWGFNFTWSFVKVMCIKSLKMVMFVARIIRQKLCIIYAFFDFFLFKNHFWLKTIFLLLRDIWLPGFHCILVLFQMVSGDRKREDRVRLWCFHFSGLIKQLMYKSNFLI